MVVCLYAAMGHDQQLQVFQPAPSGTRKVSCYLYFLIYLSERSAGLLTSSLIGVSDSLVHVRTDGPEVLFCLWTLLYSGLDVACFS